MAQDKASTKSDGNRARDGDVRLTEKTASEKSARPTDGAKKQSSDYKSSGGAAGGSKGGKAKSGGTSGSGSGTASGKSASSTSGGDRSKSR
jgi:hypothetical protein